MATHVCVIDMYFPTCKTEKVQFCNVIICVFPFRNFGSNVPCSTGSDVWPKPWDGSVSGMVFETSITISGWQFVGSAPLALQHGWKSCTFPFSVSAFWHDYIYICLWMELLMCAVAAQVFIGKMFFKCWETAPDAILPRTTELASPPTAEILGWAFSVFSCLLSCWKPGPWYRRCPA